MHSSCKHIMIELKQERTCTAHHYIRAVPSMVSGPTAVSDRICTVHKFVCTSQKNFRNFCLHLSECLYNPVCSDQTTELQYPSETCIWVVGTLSSPSSLIARFVNYLLRYNTSAWHGRGCVCVCIPIQRQKCWSFDECFTWRCLAI